MVDVDGSCGLIAQVGWLGLRLAATLHSVCIHQINRMNNGSDSEP